MEKVNVSDVLPWFNVLFVPCLALLVKINDRLATLEAVARHHGGRLRRLDGIES